MSGGSLLALLFPTDGRPGGPPFHIDPSEASAHFDAAGLTLERIEVPTTSHRARRGKEHLLRLHKPATTA